MPIRVYSPTEHHEMQFVGTLESGAQHWHCPQCGRRISMRFNEESGSVDVDILAPGDIRAGHSGGAGVFRLQVGAIQSAKAPLHNIDYSIN